MPDNLPHRAPRYANEPVVKTPKDHIQRALWLLRALEQDADINMSAEDIVAQAIAELSQCET